jgi:Fe-S-cluster containining protein
LWRLSVDFFQGLGQAFRFIQSRYDNGNTHLAGWRKLLGMSEAWYQDGLRFRCTRCGHCCTGSPGYVWVTEKEIESIAGCRGETPYQTQALFTRQVGRRRSLREKSNGDCVFYDRSLGCTVYESRPVQCRTWPFWESNVGTPEAWQRTCEICPGSGTGELISPEEIASRLNAIRL